MLHKMGGLLNLPIFSLTSGNKIAEVKNFILNTETEKLQGIVVEEDGFIDLKDVYSISAEAIMVVLEKITDKRPLAKLEPPSFLPEDLIGTPIISESGKAVGEIGDIILDGTTTMIQGFEVSDGLFKDLVSGRTQIFLSDIVAFGEDVIVIKKEKDKGEV
jgi:uncharacterized protein YrrD